LWEGQGVDDPTMLQCKAIQNWHNESLLYNDYMIKKKN
jgi:hypothetical protein